MFIFVLKKQTEEEKDLQKETYNISDFFFEEKVQQYYFNLNCTI
jgi:hypothetical protein